VRDAYDDVIMWRFKRIRFVRFYYLWPRVGIYIYTHTHSGIIVVGKRRARIVNLLKRRKNAIHV